MPDYSTFASGTTGGFRGPNLTCNTDNNCNYGSPVIGYDINIKNGDQPNKCVDLNLFTNGTLPSGNNPGQWLNPSFIAAAGRSPVNYQPGSGVGKQCMSGVGSWTLHKNMCTSNTISRGTSRQTFFPDLPNSSGKYNTVDQDVFTCEPNTTEGGQCMSDRDCGMLSNTNMQMSCISNKCSVSNSNSNSKMSNK